MFRIYFCKLCTCSFAFKQNLRPIISFLAPRKDTEGRKSVRETPKKNVALNFETNLLANIEDRRKQRQIYLRAARPSGAVKNPER